ncbi:hypothetical protein [Vibrio barjaei]|uniref:hypothetical protein n=1 Tax=Vibrio barjaei TaxID=1676683 RepID=UPI002283F4A7|nr:hypothetical protein [Vibrio barjaei]MCY9870354.1 hypothetical protein [Vibrio barjaei]
MHNLVSKAQAHYKVLLENFHLFVDNPSAKLNINSLNYTFCKQRNILSIRPFNTLIEIRFSIVFDDKHRTLGEANFIKVDNDNNALRKENLIDQIWFDSKGDIYHVLGEEISHSNLSDDDAFLNWINTSLERLLHEQQFHPLKNSQHSLL